MFNRWPTLLLTVALLTGIAIFFKRFDFLLINELRACISIVFGFASSCLLLCLVWLLQREPILDSWTQQNSDIPAPNMHPRASLGETTSIVDARNNLRQISSSTIRTVSSLLDKPPNYEDALLNSKPINYSSQVDHNDKENHDCRDEREKSVDISIASSCQQLLGSATNQNYCAKHHQDNQNHVQHNVSPRECNLCGYELISSNNLDEDNHRNQRAQQAKHGVSHLARSIVRGLTQSSSVVGSHSSFQSRTTRKPSFCQLDVNQLVYLSCSPPKYSDLSFSLSRQEETSNRSNEPRAGSNC